MALPVNEGSDLCRNCGLCCDGTLFYGVELQPDEVEAADLNGLMPLRGQEGVRFDQPCPRFAAICQIYPVRPLCCRKYRCFLLSRLEKGEVDFETAQEIVVEARRLASQADNAGLPGEDRAAARRRWDRTFRAGNTNGADSDQESSGDPRWLVAMTALNYFLDRHFRKPGTRLITLETTALSTSDEE